MASILVTGGSGFIGSHFCRRAIEAGHQLTVLTRDTQRAAKRVPAETRLVESLEQVQSNAKFNIVVNLAGEPLAGGRWNQALKKKFYQSRIGTTEQLYKFFSDWANGPPELLISGSAIGYYGAGTTTMDENSQPHDGFSHSLCDAWEKQARQFKNMGTRVCLLRTGIVLGDREGALARMLPAFKFGLGGPMGTGKQWMSWIHIDDMVNLIFHCMKRTDLTLAVNATSPNPVTNREFSKTLASVLRRPALLPMPASMIKLIFGEMGQELLLQGQRIIPTKAIETHFEFQHPELRGALENLLT